MGIPEDVARQLDPMVRSAVFVNEGGQKTVFRFAHESAEWALKMIDLADTERRLGEAASTVLARVDREVRILSEINSPHLPKLGPLDPRTARVEGHPYFAYSEEYIEGQSLADLLVVGPLLPNTVVAVGCDVGVALSEIWARRVVHRDVKPTNILERTSDHSFVLLDPGYALDLADGSLTRTGGVVGTAPYYSPEQLAVGNKRALDCRSDLYSLGIALYEAVTGSHPYFRPGMTYTQLYAAIRTGVPPSPQSYGCPDGLSGVIMRLIRKRPHLRYRSPEEFLRDIEAQRRGEV